MKLLNDNHLFWDSDVSAINPRKHRQAIIERVLERGSWNNIKEIISYYGKDEVAKAAKKARWFSDKTMHFISGYFDIPL
jgi:hypothetical protein